MISTDQYWVRIRPCSQQKADRRLHNICLNRSNRMAEYRFALRRLMPVFVQPDLFDLEVSFSEILILKNKNAQYNNRPPLKYIPGANGANGDRYYMANINGKPVNPPGLFHSTGRIKKYQLYIPAV